MDDDGLLEMDGYDDCKIGVVYGFGGKRMILYSAKRVIEKLINTGMSYDDAVDYHYFNQVNAYVDDCMPVFLDDLDE